MKLSRFLLRLVSVVVLLCGSAICRADIWRYGASTVYDPVNRRWVYLYVRQDDVLWDDTIYAQFIDENGSTSGPPIAISSGDWAMQPAAAVNTHSGEVLVVWADFVEDAGGDIHCRLIHADGSLGDETVIDADPFVMQDQPRAAYDPTGRVYLTVWQAWDFVQDAHFRRVNEDGTTRGSTMPFLMDAIEKGPPDCCARPGGDFAVVFERTGWGEIFTGTIYAGGGSVSNEKQVCESTPPVYGPTIGPAGKGCVVAWNCDPEVDGTYGVFARCTDSEGNPTGNVTVVYDACDCGPPSVEPFGNDQCVLTWRTENWQLRSQLYGCSDMDRDTFSVQCTDGLDKYASPSVACNLTGGVALCAFEIPEWDFWTNPLPGDVSFVLIEGWGDTVKTWSECDGNAAWDGDPVSTAQGELFGASVDLRLGGPAPLSFHRFYASTLTEGKSPTSGLGLNWSHNFDIRADVTGTVATVSYYRGKTIAFDYDGTNWNLRAGEKTPFQLITSGPGHKLMDPRSSRMFTFDGTGKLTSITDRNGNSHTLTYTGDNLTQVSDGLGRTLDFTYSSDMLTRVTDQSGRFVAYSYGGDHLTRYTNALGKVTTYAYTNTGPLLALMTVETRPEGNVPYQQLFDGDGRVCLQMDSASNATVFAYDPVTGATTATDPLSNTVTHVHTNLQDLSGYKDAENASFAIGYDSERRRVSVTDRYGDTTRAAYHDPSGKVAGFTNALGQGVSVTYADQDQDGFTFHVPVRADHADGTSVGYEYDTRGNLIARTNRTGKVWRYSYDNQGLVTAITNPSGGRVAMVYNPDGTRVSATDHWTNTTTYLYDSLKRLRRVDYQDLSSRAFTYDVAGRLVAATNERSKVMTFTYDDNERLTAVVDPLGHTNRFVYDGNDRVVARIDRLGKTTKVVYNELGLVGSVTNAAGEAVSFTYDSHRRLATVTDAGGKVSRYSYDLEGVLTGVTDPLSNTWSFASDKVGRRTGITSPLGRTSQYTYDALGRLISRTDPLGRARTYSHDVMGRLTNVVFPEGVQASYERDDLGNVTRMTDPRGYTWDRGYDVTGRLRSRTDPLTNTTTYAYDERSRLALVTLPDATLAPVLRDPTGNITNRQYGGMPVELKYAYDDNGRLVSADGLALAYDARGDITNCNGIAMTRDTVGRLKSVTLAPGKVVNYTYNSRGLLWRVTDWVGGITELTYDDAARLTMVTRPNSWTNSVSYDDDGRLVSLTEQRLAVSSSITLTRDANGNITSAARNTPLALPLSSGALPLNYDGACQVSGRTYDKLGHLTLDGPRQYLWDYASRLQQCIEGPVLKNYTYDALGARTSVESGGVTNGYVWNYALAMRSVSIVRQAGSDVRYYVHLPNGRLLHSVEASDDSRKFYHYDETGTTLFLSDDAGAMTDTYMVTPYGQVVGKTGTTPNPFVYLGALGVMQEESLPGLYYMRARYYDAVTRRFISRDPERLLSPRHVNPYQYAFQNPLRYGDPSGLPDFVQFNAWYSDTRSCGLLAEPLDSDVACEEDMAYCVTDDSSRSCTDDSFSCVETAPSDVCREDDFSFDGVDDDPAAGFDCDAPVDGPVRCSLADSDRYCEDNDISTAEQGCDAPESDPCLDDLCDGYWPPDQCREAPDKAFGQSAICGPPPPSGNSFGVFIVGGAAPAIQDSSIQRGFGGVGGSGGNGGAGGDFGELSPEALGGLDPDGHELGRYYGDDKSIPGEDYNAKRVLVRSPGHIWYVGK